MDAGRGYFWTCCCCTEFQTALGGENNVFRLYQPTVAAARNFFFLFLIYNNDPSEI